MRIPLFAFAFLASAVTASPASTETTPLELPSRFLVVPASPGSTKHLKVGDPVFETPLKWKSAAILSSPVDVAADDRRSALRQGQALVETRLRFDDSKFVQAIAFCEPRVADPIRKSPLFALGAIGAALARSTTDAQFCVIDNDRDGLVEHSVLVNAGSPAARSPVRILATPYVLTAAADVSEGDRFVITYRGGNHFEVAIIQQGHPRRFDTLKFEGPTGTQRFNRFLRVQKRPDGSVEVPAPGATFIARNYDKANKSIEVQWPTITQSVAIPIPDVVRASNGFAY